MNFVLACCARVESQRLPRKITLPLAGRTVYEYQVQGLVESRLPFIVVTPRNAENDWVEEKAKARGALLVYRDDHSALAGMVEAGRIAGVEHVVRITHDDLFTDFSLLTWQLQQHMKSGADITVSRNVPDACSAEVYRLSVLETMLARHGSDAREMIGNFHGEFAEENHEPSPESWVADRQQYRLELDWQEDLDKIRMVIGALGEYPSSERIVAFLRDNPWTNAHNHMRIKS